MRERDWHSCYDDGWQGIISPASFAHPAKFAYGLIRRIITHGLEQGWFRKGDLIGDVGARAGARGQRPLSMLGLLP